MRVYVSEGGMTGRKSPESIESVGDSLFTSGTSDHREEGT